MNRDEIIALYCKENNMDIDLYVKVCDELKAYKTFSYMREEDANPTNKTVRNRERKDDVNIFYNKS